MKLSTRVIRLGLLVLGVIGTSFSHKPDLAALFMLMVMIEVLNDG